MPKETRIVELGPGFYKKIDDQLVFAKNRVTSPTYTIVKEEKDTYIYPVDGWSWFEDEDTAREALGIPELPVEA